jgi:hypothetical protein
MTDQNTTAAPAADTTASGALDAAGLPTATPLADIKAMATELDAHIDAHDIGETASTWLASAREALRCAVKYVEGHFAELETKAKAELASIEAKLDEPMTSTDVAAAGAATASAV